MISRVLEGLVKVAREKDYFPKDRTYSFSFVSILIWGIVMYLFERDKTQLQPSLTSSMTFLYHDSDSWKTVWDFIPLEFPSAAV